MTEELKKWIKELTEILDDKQGDIGVVQPYVWEICEAAKRGEDINEAIPVLKRTISEHWCDHGCPVESTAGEAMTIHYKNFGDSKKLAEMVNDPSTKVRFGVFWALNRKTSMTNEEMSLLVKLLVDEEELLRFDVSGFLGRFAEQKKENAKQVLDEINKSQIDKNKEEIRKVIRVCEKDVKKLKAKQGGK
jgi:hypothetical protein